MYRVFYNALREIKLKYCQQGLLIGIKIGYVHVPQVGRFVFFASRIEIERRGWPPQPPTFSISFDPIFALKKKVLVKC